MTNERTENETKRPRPHEALAEGGLKSSKTSVERKPRGEARIQSLARADAILGHIADAGKFGIRLNELTAKLDLNKTTIFNLAGTLAHFGAVVQDPETRAYKLGPRTLQLGLSAQRHNSLQQFCGPLLERLCLETNETVNIAIPLVTSAVIIDSREGGHKARLTSYAGTMAPYHATALGKAIFAFYSEARRKEHYARVTLTALAPLSICEIEPLEANLTEIRKARHAFDLEEMEIGCHCVAVPVFGPNGDVAASISVAGLRDRLDQTKLKQYADLIQAEVFELESKLRIVD